MEIRNANEIEKIKKHFLVGSWQHHKSENLEAFYKQKHPRMPTTVTFYKRPHSLRINAIARYIKDKKNLVLKITNDDKLWILKSTYDPLLARSVEISLPIYKHKIICYEDEEFNDGFNRCVLTRENDRKLVQVCKTGNGDQFFTITYELVGQQLIMKIDYEGVAAVRYFNKFEP